MLKKLSLKDLSKFFVCHVHFEKRFVTNRLRLYRGAYPTLFTAKEMDTGIPASPHKDFQPKILLQEHNYAQRKRRHEDHSYHCKDSPLKELQQTQEPNELQEHNYAKLKERHEDHSYYSKDSPLKELQQSKDFGPSTSKHSKTTLEPDAQHLPELLPCTDMVTPKKTRKVIIRKKKLTPRCHKIFREYKIARKQLNYMKRAKRAIKFSKGEKFEKLTHGLNPLSKKILWMQITQCTKKSKGRRFTEDEKIIALAIMKQSPRSYNFLRKIFILPSVRTINKLVNNLKVETGINPHIFSAITSEVNDWDEAKKFCSVIFDEVALETGLVYDQHKDNICGLVELDIKTTDFADHALVFMIRGALHKWQQPIAFYFCKGATSSLVLKNILQEVLTEVTKTGLIPVALISDQGTAFQSAINMLKEETRNKQILSGENIDDTIVMEGNKVHVIFDPPHLIKGIRNNFLTKNIRWNGKVAKWSDIVEVYLTDCRHAQMRLLHKLNDEHVMPEKNKKMKVKNCTRVLSKTVASALAYTAAFSHYADGRTVSNTLRNTSETVSFFDDLFDSTNGASLSIKNKGKPLRQAVTRTSRHLDFWRNATRNLSSMRFVTTDGKEVTVPSQKNFIKTIKSLEQLWHFFKSKGVKIMRPRYFNSDPIENFFGQMRAYSFRYNNPTCHAFKTIFRSLLITRFINFHNKSYNCENSSGEHIIKLKKIFEPNQELKVLAPITSNVIMPPKESDNIQAEARKERLHIHSRAYTAGWVVKKCTNKFHCNNCTKSLTQVNESSVHKWIAYREYKEFKNKNKLTYPSEKAVRHFSAIIKISNEYLELKPNSPEISKEILSIIKSKMDFDDFITCPIHAEILLEYFIITTVKLSIFNWCSIISKILKGIDNVRLKQLPYMQNKALITYQKRLKNKKQKNK